METAEQNALLPVLKAIADASRLTILGILSRRELSVGAIARELSLSEPTISHHLARLIEVGFVSVRQVGTSRIYRLNVEEVALFQKSLASHSLTDPPDDRPADASDASKVLKSFVKNGRLVKIPQTLKKRRVVLEWLVDKLDRRKRYPEKEINVFLEQYHEDFATLRRELVDLRYLQRHESVYWRM